MDDTDTLKQQDATRPGRRAVSGERTSRGATFVLIQLALLILLQKVALPIGDGALEIPLLVVLIGLGVHALRNPIAIVPVRVALFSVLVATIVVSILATGRGFPPGALLLFVVIYLPLLVALPIDERGFRRIMRGFIALMLAVAGLVLVEQLINYTIGHGFWPNLDAILPGQLQFPGFNYLQPMSYGSSLIKPNAIVFLEVSYVSQFLAIALIAEILFFRRPPVLAALAAGVLLTFAGTGLILLALMIPFLLSRLDRRLVASGILIAIVAAGVLLTTDWFVSITGRLGEFTQPNSSGYQRYTGPMITTIRALGDPTYFFTGLGPGNVPTTNQNPLPITKLVTEYGVLTTFAFYAMFCVALYRRARSKVLATALFLFFNLGGGSLSVPLCVLLCVLLGTIAPRQQGKAHG